MSECSSHDFLFIVTSTTILWLTSLLDLVSKCVAEFSFNVLPPTNLLTFWVKISESNQQRQRNKGKYFIYLFFFFFFLGGGRAASGLVLLGLPMTMYDELMSYHQVQNYNGTQQGLPMTVYNESVLYHQVQNCNGTQL